MPKTTLYVATHKLFIPPMISYYKPIAIGKNQNWLPYLKDNQGENIADKNSYYCELTALYWIWKNDCSKYVGLMHYHRYFYKEDYILEEEIKEILNNKEIIAPKPIYFKNTIYEQYAKSHYKQDLVLACEEIKKRDYTYRNAIEDTLNGHKFYVGNMFITSREILEDYLAFLFLILFDLEKQIPYLQYSIYNQRVFGFLAERIFNIYLRKKAYALYEYPILDTLSFHEHVQKRIKNIINIQYDRRQERKLVKKK